MGLYYLFKYWMRDVAIVRGEMGVATSFINEAGWITLLLGLKLGVDLTIFGIIYFYLCGLIVLGLIGRFLRKKEIPELNNTLQNELNKELMEIHRDIKLIKEKIK